MLTATGREGETTMGDDYYLDRAVRAVKALLETGPGTDGREVDWLGRDAADAVTKAVAGGHCLHSQIAAMAGCSGLRVAEMITDWSAQADALRREEHQAQLYAEQVRAATRSHVVRRHGEQGRGSVTQMEVELDMSRTSLHRWIREAAEETRQRLDLI